MARTTLLKQIVHVFEVFNMSTLIAGHGNSVGIFLYGRFYYFLYASIMSQMDDFTTCTLNNTAHHIYSCIVAVKQASGRYNTNFMGGYIDFLFYHAANLTQNKQLSFKSRVTIRKSIPKTHMKFAK